MRIGFRGILYYSQNKEPPNPILIIKGPRLPHQTKLAWSPCLGFALTYTPQHRIPGFTSAGLYCGNIQGLHGSIININ